MASGPWSLAGPGRPDHPGGVTTQIPPGTVVVGVDGSEHAARAVVWAARQASLLGVALKVLHCFVDAAPGTRPGLVGAADDSSYEDLRLLLAESVAGLGEKFPDVEVDLQLGRGLVDECLLGQAPPAELVVVGRTDARGWARLLSASCALAVLERATTTVAVVPESDLSSRQSAGTRATRERTSS
jgi:nucleotide-binding universal stress UspA family protein